jgi:hypothetical protein
VIALFAAITIAYRVIWVIVALFVCSLAVFAVGYVTFEIFRAVRGLITRRRNPLARRPRPALPLSEEEGGEAERFAALIWAYRNVNIPEPVYGPGAERGTS